MPSLEQSKQKANKSILPIHSPNKLAWLLGIPRKELEKFSARTDLHYSPYPKIINGKKRLIANPKEALKDVQRKIDRRILNKFSFPVYVVGGIKGRSLKDHLKFHIRKAVVITLDVKDCFPGITNKKVFNIWRHQLNCSPTVARLATKLTTFQGHLPLGAPTSNNLASIAILPCLERVNKIAEKHKIRLSQYVDDSALSGRSFPKDFIALIVDEFLKKGFRLSHRKIKIMRAGVSQQITKKVVNRKISSRRSDRNNLRAALYELSNTAPNDKTYRKRYYSVRGRIEELSHYHPAMARKMLQEFNNFLKP